MAFILGRTHASSACGRLDGCTDRIDERADVLCIHLCTTEAGEATACFVGLQPLREWRTYSARTGIATCGVEPIVAGVASYALSPTKSLHRYASYRSSGALQQFGMGMANDGRADRSALRDNRFGVVSSSGDATPGGRTLDESLLGVQ